ncbi:hypothetical protein H0H92_002368 [Tricholoma furcatifolium]|nr:hypothetical protein H0H92_002368 [Tricholoma furcatifolium]
MNLTYAFIAILPMVSATFAETITVLGVQAPITTTILIPTVFPTPLVTIYPIGTGANGETTYAEDVVGSVNVEVYYTDITVDGIITNTAYTTISSTMNPVTVHGTCATLLRFKY